MTNTLSWMRGALAALLLLGSACKGCGGVPAALDGDDDADGYSRLQGGDCDDTNADINPGATEICNDGVDNNCDARIDAQDLVVCGNSQTGGCTTDADGDGYCAEKNDCDDGNSRVHPDGAEHCANAIDDNCDGQIDGTDARCPNPLVCPDGDNDGFPDAMCGGTDCDDNRVTVNPFAGENCGDTFDNDCNGLADGADAACPPAGTCPNHPEITNNDADGDMYVSRLCGGDDCDDNVVGVHPTALELCTDSIDKDCDGVIGSAMAQCAACAGGAPDADSDGHGDLVCGGDDCQDDPVLGPLIFPGQNENCVDQLDNNCDGLVDTLDPMCVPMGICDADGDGAFNASCGGQDCADNDNTVKPGLAEVCGDGKDNNCNLLVDIQEEACQPFTVTSVSPSALTCTGTGRLGQTLQVLGNRISSSTQFYIVRSTCTSGFPCGSAVTVTSVTQATGDSATINADVLSCTDASNPPGYYDLVAINGTDTMRLSQAIFISVEAPPTVTDVTPTSSSTQGDSVVTIQGTGFVTTPSVRFVQNTPPFRSFFAPDVTYFATNKITATAPSQSQGMPVGSYRVQVINPDQQGAYWRTPAGSIALFKVTTVPPPRITLVVPARVQATTSATVTVYGTDIQVGATARFLYASGNQFLPCGNAFATASVTNQLGGTVAGGSTTACDAAHALSKGVYPIRVTNPDGQFVDWFAFQVTPSSNGKISGYSDCNGDGAANNAACLSAHGTMPEMNTVRALHASSAGFDDLQNGFVYTSGGVTNCLDGSCPNAASYMDSAPLDAVIADTTEYFGVDLTGSISTPQIATTYGPSGFNARVPVRLNQPREGHSMVRVGRDLYAIGGRTTGNVVLGGSASGNGACNSGTNDCSVETARILGRESAPAISYVLPIAGGTSKLPAGTWFYRVAYVGSTGEGLPSRELFLYTTEPTRIEVQWEAVDDPDAGSGGKYLIFRSLAADGRGQSARLIAEVAATGSVSCKSVATGTAVGGSCYRFIDDGGTLIEGGAITVKTPPTPGHLAFRTVAGAGPSAGSYTYRIEGVYCPAPTGSITCSSLPAGCEDMQAGYTITATTPGSQTIQLSWDAAVAGSNIQAVRVYRGSNCIGVSTGTTFNDTNIAGSVGTPEDRLLPLTRGSISAWHRAMNSTRTHGVELVVPREGHRSQLVDIPHNTNPQRNFIYTVGGRASTATNSYSATTERVEVFPDGTLGNRFASTDAENDFQLECTNPLDTTRDCTGASSSPIDFRRWNGDFGPNTYTARPLAYHILVTNIGRADSVIPPVIPPPPCESNPDADGDGYRSLLCGGCDCNDADATITISDTVTDRPFRTIQVKATRGLNRVQWNLGGDPRDSNCSCTPPGGCPSQCDPGYDTCAPSNPSTGCTLCQAGACVQWTGCATDPDTGGVCGATGVCDVTSLVDKDGDGYKTMGPSGEACCVMGCVAGPEPLTTCDCNDNNANIHPNASDICGDGILQNCCEDTTCTGGDPCSSDGDGNGCPDGDNDCDGYFTPSAVGGQVCCSGATCGGACDCDDSNAFINPGRQPSGACGSGNDANCCALTPCSGGSGGTCPSLTYNGSGSTAACTTDGNFDCCYRADGTSPYDFDGDGYMSCTSQCGRTIDFCYRGSAFDTPCDCDDGNKFKHPFPGPGETDCAVRITLTEQQRKVQYASVMSPETMGAMVNTLRQVVTALPMSSIVGIPLTQALVSTVPQDLAFACNRNVNDAGTWLIAYFGTQEGGAARENMAFVRLRDMCSWNELGDGTAGAIPIEMLFTDPTVGHFIYEGPDAVCQTVPGPSGIGNGDCLNAANYSPTTTYGGVCSGSNPPNFGGQPQNTEGHYCFQGWEGSDAGAYVETVGGGGLLMFDYLYSWGGSSATSDAPDAGTARYPYCPVNAVNENGSLNTQVIADPGGSPNCSKRPSQWDADPDMIPANFQSTGGGSLACTRGHYTVVPIYSYQFMIGGFQKVGGNGTEMVDGTCGSINRILHEQ